jgi:hypothetical protein
MNYPQLEYADIEGCPVCGLAYVQESEEDRRIHRSRHRQVLNIYHPKPDAALAARFAQQGAFLPIHRQSPRWLRNRLQNMATMFRREQGLDFRPHDADER